MIIEGGCLTWPTMKKRPAGMFNFGMVLVSRIDEVRVEFDDTVPIVLERGEDGFWNVVRPSPE